MHPTTRDPSAITDCYPELQYYAISQGSSESPREQSSQLMQLSTMQSQQQQQQQQRQLVETNDSNNMTSGTQQQQPRHLHPIPICRNSALISPHQLQEILPGSVFADHPSMGHYHYHIIPSRGTLPPEPMPGTISRLDQQQQNHHHQQQLDQQQQQQQSHYQTSRQQQAQPRTLLRPARSIDQFSNKDAGGPSSTSTLTTTTTTTGAYNNYDRYSQIHSRDTGSKKISSFGELVNKNSMPLVELQSDSQTTIASGKGKCQCHAIAQQHMRMKREASETGSSIVTDHHGSSIQERNSGVNGSASQQQQQPPALPPRPPPRPSGRRYEVTPPETSNERRHVGNGDGANACCKKYVVLCCLCGGLSAAVGSLFLAVRAVLSAHTASLALFETVPSYIPGTMLILIGLVTMLLARRKYRYGFLMKVCGSVSVVCALVCVLVAVTTTVVHMSRLQGLRQCLYTAGAKSCTCFGPQQSPSTDAGVLFEGAPHCDAVHGALYACLRALFGVSVAGILACIFSCMLVYQLLSHEKKKMYWEQLELRCRSLYGQGPGGAGLVGARAAGTCGCCNDCGGIGPWWAQSPGSLYTPNPDLTPAGGWRLPWTRSRGPAPSTDTNYGFNHHHPAGGTLAQAGGILASTTGVVHHHQQQQQHHHHNPQQHHQQQQQQHHQLGGSGNDSSAIVPYGILGHHPHHAIGQPASAYSMLQAQAGHHEDVYGRGSGSGPYSVLDSAVPLWGPPPPCSDPNSPARRPMMAFTTLDPRNRIGKRISDDVFEFSNVDYGRTSEIKRATSNYENAEQVTSDNNPADSADIMSANNISNAVSSTGVGAGNNNSGNNNNSDEQQRTTGSTAAATATTTTSIATMSTSHGLRGSSHKKSLKGVENAGFTLAQEPPSSGAVLPSSLTASKLQQQQQQQQQTESELYFGDVSSCCGPESSLYDVATEKDGKNETEAGTSNHPSAQFPKRPSSSKRSRRHHQHHQSQLSPDHNTSSCSSSAASDEAVVAFSRHNDLTSAEVDYEVIRQQQQQQRRYDYEQRQQSSNQNVSVVSVESSPEATRDEGDGARGRESINDVEQRI